MFLILIALFVFIIWFLFFRESAAERAEREAKERARRIREDREKERQEAKERELSQEKEMWKAKREAEEQARREREAEEQAKRKAEEQAQQEAEWAVEARLLAVLEANAAAEKARRKAEWDIQRAKWDAEAAQRQAERVKMTEENDLDRSAWITRLERIKVVERVIVARNFQTLTKEERQRLRTLSLRKGKPRVFNLPDWMDIPGIESAELPGVYTIALEGTDKIYVGESTCVARRWFEHWTMFKRGKHHNPGLKRAIEDGLTPVFSLITIMPELNGLPRPGRVEEILLKAEEQEIQRQKNLGMNVLNVDERYKMKFKFGKSEDETVTRYSSWMPPYPGIKKRATSNQAGTRPTAVGAPAVGQEPTSVSIPKTNQDQTPAPTSQPVQLANIVVTPPPIPSKKTNSEPFPVTASQSIPKKSDNLDDLLDEILNKNLSTSEDFSNDEDNDDDYDYDFSEEEETLPSVEIPDFLHLSDYLFSEEAESVLKTQALSYLLIDSSKVSNVVRDGILKYFIDRVENEISERKFDYKLFEDIKREYWDEGELIIMKAYMESRLEDILQQRDPVEAK